MKSVFYRAAMLSIGLSIGIALAGCQVERSAMATTPASAPISARASVEGPAVISPPTIPQRTVNISDFGAVGDGQTDNTGSFAMAIDACASAGGGRVIVPAGNWLTGPIRLQSEIDFHLEAGAQIHFSRKLDDYPMYVGNYEGQETVICTSPLSGDGLHDVAITGSGVIDGGGDAWRPVKKNKVSAAEWNNFVKRGGIVDAKTGSWYPSAIWLKGPKDLAALRASHQTPRIEDYRKYRDLLRPPMVFLSNCKNLLLEGPTFRNSPSWNIHLLYSDNITVHKVTIFNEYYAQNGDGIDIDSCRNVCLTESNISAGDDVVCLKSGRDAEGRRVGRATENVTVAHCTLGHGHGGFAIGSEMSGGVKNVEFYDCVLKGTDEALRFKTVRGRGGVVENVNIHNIEMWDIKNCCIWVDMYYQVKKPVPTTQKMGRGGVPADPEAPEQDQSVAKPLVVTQEKAEPVGPGTPQFRGITIRNILCHGANIAMQLRGLPELPLEGVTIEHADITSKQGGAIVDADGITLRDVSIKSASVPAFQIQDATHLTMEDVDVVPVAGK